MFGLKIWIVGVTILACIRSSELYWYIGGTTCLTYDDYTGAHYLGTQNVTKNGDACQRWDSQTPHTHRFTYLNDHSNYCRNPEKTQSAPWCFTVNPEVRWALCDIPHCGY